MEKKIRIKTNLLFGIMAIVVSAIIFILIPQQIAVSEIVQEYVNGRFIPYVVASIMMLVGIVNVIKSLVFKKEDIKEIDINLEKKKMIYIAGIVVYAIMVGYVSFVIASLLFSVLTLWYMKCKTIKTYIIVCVCVIIIALLFKFGLKVNFGGLLGI